jgi:hypothetical protein
MERLFERRALLRVLDRPAELTIFLPIAYSPGPERAGASGRDAYLAENKKWRAIQNKLQTLILLKLLCFAPIVWKKSAN